MQFVSFLAKAILILLFFIGSPGLYAIGLECDYVYDIQEKYLDLHINFSNFDRKKKFFKNKLSSLEIRVKDQFIKSLDSEKLYFTQSDVNNIRKQLKNIFTKVKKGNCSDLDRVYELYYKRLSERVQFANEYLTSKFILEPTMELTLDSRKRKRRKTIRQINSFHKKYIQYQMANAIVASDEKEYEKQVAEAKKNILRHYNRLQKQVKSWSVNLSEKEKKNCYKRKKSSGKVTICKPYKWYSVYLNSFAKGFDPHSGYLSQEDHEDFEINMKLSLEGIGASLSSKYGHTVIERLIAGGAAARSRKLKSKDKILAVGQSAKKMVNIFDMDLRDVVSMIRGEKGTAVHLKIMRIDKEKDKKIFTVRLIRDRVNLDDQAASIFYFDRRRNNKNHKIGVIMLPSFYGEGRSGGRSVTDDVQKLLSEAKKKQVSAIVLDMSNNGGGSLTEAVQLAGLFFAKGSVVRQLVKTKNGDRYLTLSDVDDTIEYSGPLVVLVNRVSASASEIVSGTLKSYKRSVIVGGDHTFGKGSIQSVERLRMGLGSVRVTVGLFFIPNGFSTQLKGVDSDIRFPSIFSNDEIGEKTLDYVLSSKKIPSFVSQSAYISRKGNKWKPITDKMISFLRENSLKRIKKDEQFQEINKDIIEMSTKKRKGYVTTIAQIFDQAKKEENQREKKEEESLNGDQKAPSPSLSKESQNEDDVEEIKKRYMERPDIQEAVNIAVDQVTWEIKANLVQRHKN